jgi:hypothetical protein
MVHIYDAPFDNLLYSTELCLLSTPIGAPFDDLINYLLYSDEVCLLSTQMVVQLMNYLLYYD